MSDPGPLDPFGGVTVAAVRASLDHEAESGRGPDSPARKQQVLDELREMIRLAEHREAHPELVPHGYQPDPAALAANREALAELMAEDAREVIPRKSGKGRRVPAPGAGMLLELEGVSG